MHRCDDIDAPGEPSSNFRTSQFSTRDCSPIEVRRTSTSRVSGNQRKTFCIPPIHVEFSQSE